MNGFSNSHTMDRDPKFYAELKEANEELIKYLEENQKKSPYFDYTNTFKSYTKIIEDLRKQYPPGEPKTSNQSIPKFSFQPTSTTTQSGMQPAFQSTFQANFQTGFQANNTQLNKQTTAVDTNKPLFSLSHTSQQNNSLFSPNNTTITGFDEANKTLNVTAGVGDNNTTTAANADEDEDAPPPESNLDKYQETGAKFQCRCKLYDRNLAEDKSASPIAYVGCGELFVKELSSPDKLHIIMRQDPDLRKVLVNQMITAATPILTQEKRVQIPYKSSEGPMKAWVIRVKDEKVASELSNLLNSLKSIASN